jgi:ribosomal RNA assembly protein
MRQYRIGVYPDRLGVIIGKKGEVKKRIEEMTGVKLEVDSKSSVITIYGNDMNSLVTAQNIIRAINHGFSPDKAFKLLDPDYTLHIIDIYTYLRKRDENNLKRVLGRIIGEKGKTKRILEETTGTNISIYRHYVAAIGLFEDIITLDEAVRRLVKGVPHKYVYEYLYNMRSMRRMGFVS